MRECTNANEMTMIETGINGIILNVISRLKDMFFHRTLWVKLDDGAIKPERAHDTDAGLDIFTPRGFTIIAGGFAKVHTGVHVQLPRNTVGLLKSKSGLNVAHGIIGEGVIDEGYDGEIVVKLYNLGSHDYVFTEGQKVIQMLIVPVLYSGVQVTDEIKGGERGSDGFGSTGR